MLSIIRLYLYGILILFSNYKTHFDMKFKFLSFIVFPFFLLVFSCKQKISIEDSVETSAYQLKMMTEAIGDSLKLPRSIKDGRVRLENIYDWTSGFFPGSLWYIYELKVSWFIAVMAINIESQEIRLLYP